MKKPSASTIIIILLLLLNSVTLGFMLLHHKQGPRSHFGPGMPPPPHERPHGPGMFIVHELNFDDKQKDDFDKMRKAHHQKTMEIHDSLHALKEKLFSGISSGDMTQANAVSDKIASFQKQLEIVTYEHFLAVRSMCNDEQKQKFDKIIPHVFEMMAPPPPPDAPRGPDDPPPPPESEKN